MGVAAWSGFECSVLAGEFGDVVEQERLFTYALAQGRAFVKAAREGKVTPSDLRSKVPSGLSMSLAGPSIDFILGRVYADATDNALTNVFTIGGSLTSESERESLARAKFTKQNCVLIGK
jgi:hypothetical protein